MKRLPCEHCERKFIDEAALARHVRAMHRKSAKLVGELRRRKADAYQLAGQLVAGEVPMTEDNKIKLLDLLAHE